MEEWRIFQGDGTRHDRLTRLPPPPPWRFAQRRAKIAPAPSVPDRTEEPRAIPFRPTQDMIRAVNAALYLRRPLLLTGKPGTGKSTLVSKVADELQIGPVLRWPINSRSTVRGGVYDYDAVGRLHAVSGDAAAVEDYLVLGPLGAALAARGRPAALLVDEIDKSDLDFANDLLNVIEEGEYEIPELRRLRKRVVVVKDIMRRPTRVTDGRLRAKHFPFVVMTSNAEREFPAPFLRRCIRLDITPPDRAELVKILEAQLSRHKRSLGSERVVKLINAFLTARDTAELSTDQLLNAVFLAVTLRETGPLGLNATELEALRTNLFRPIAT